MNINLKIVLSVVVAALLAMLPNSSASASVPSFDTNLEPVVTDNLPVIGATTMSNVKEGDATSNSNTAYPLYAPYAGATSDAWWDYLVAEQQQARLPLIKLITSGYPKDVSPDITTDFGANPYYLPKYIQALQRYGAANSVKFACCPFGVSGAYETILGLPKGTQVDFSNEASWTSVWWNNEIGPWFAAIPKENYYMLRGGIPMEFWGLSATGPGGYSHQQGNISRFFEFINQKVQALYGVQVSFVICDTTTSYDTTLATYPRLIAMNPWFQAPVGYGYTTFTPYGQSTPVTYGTMVPGWTQGNNDNIRIPRNGPNGTGTMGDTANNGFNAGISSKADIISIEGWTDNAEGVASWRASTESNTLNTKFWLYPNQYGNIIRSFADLRTTTLRLEAESCDKYNDPGGVGGVFRRSPSKLDIKTLQGSGWAISPTVAGEWIEWDGLSYSAGNYKFPMRYSSAVAGHVVRLYVDGNALPDVTVPSTGDNNNYDTCYLGQATLSHGNHTLKLYFVDGNVNVDWVFTKKYDPVMGLRSLQNNQIVSADLGGNSVLTANRSSVGAWEQITVDDLNGGILNSGDSVALQVHDGLYASAENGGGWAVSPNRRTQGAWETWTIVKVNGSGQITDGNQVAFKSNNGRYLNVQSNGSVDVTGWSVGTAQTFTISNFTQPSLPPKLIPGTSISLQAQANGKYVTSDIGGTTPLIANKPSAGPWEHFTVVDAGGGKIGLRANSNGKYVTSDISGTTPLIANKTSVGAWETFNEVDAGGGKIALRANSNGKFVSADNAGANPLIGNRISYGAWESYTVGN